MNRISFIALILVGSLLFAACHKVPFTDRRQARLIPVSQINTLSYQEYDSFISQAKTVKGGQDVERVRRIGNRLVQAVEVYYKANGLEDVLSEFDWEFNVVEDPNINAFCMPGGKVVVYTGILPVCQNDDGLAVVMGHELAHALAHHGNERMSNQMGISGALSVVDAALAVNANSATSAEERQKREMGRQLIMGAAGVGAQYGIMLPFSRKHESEADKIGLYLMAIGGYDISEAAPFWERMSAAGGEAPPEFLSTHPSPETRSTNLREWQAEARAVGQKYRLP